MKRTDIPWVIGYLCFFPCLNCSNHINLLAKIDAEVGNEVDVTVDHFPIICEEGYFCDDGKTYPCGRVGYFCISGSERPSNANIGYYTIGGTATTRSDEKICELGTYCIEGERFLCPRGRYGSSYGLSSATCSGLCQEGYYCEEGSVLATQTACGNSSLHCPIGSFYPTKVDVGYYTVGGHSNVTRVSQIISPIGHYALNSILYPCPAGTYGDTTGLSTDCCSGTCKGGWYCPAGSTSPKQYACGSEHFYCPQGVGKIQVQKGFYTSRIEDECAPGAWRTLTDFNCRLCEDGTYKFKKGNDKNLCLPCGFQALSTDSRISCLCRVPEIYKKLGKELIFNPLTGECNEFEIGQIRTESWYTEDTQLTRTIEKECEIGFYCTDGIRYPCQPGKYGVKKNETRTDCSGDCKAGYWCRFASTNATEHVCGTSNVFCPQGSAIPTYIQRGYFTNEDTSEEVRYSQFICPKGHWCSNGIRYKCRAGRWGGSLGLYTQECDGLCLEGFYCPEGSTNMTQTACGNESVYCPKGTKLPLSVDSGYYSVPSVFTDHNTETLININNYPENSTMCKQVLCEPGYWCLIGKKYQCPGGSFGFKSGAFTEDVCLPCQAGYYCPSYPGPPSLNSTHDECGTYRFCPEGSEKPLFVKPGYYGTGGISENNYFEQHICQPGYYCDRAKKYICPAGTYGNISGLFTRHCSGFCPAGFFCPQGAVEPNRCPFNTFSTSRAATCIDCGPRSLDIGEDGSHKCQNARICCSQ